jgi:hypothetical protein
VRSIISTLSCFAIVMTATGARATDLQAESFARIYFGICLRNITNFDALREKLRQVPQLPSEKAALFLQGSPGQAYPVPDPNGTFVVALPADKHMCALYAKRLNASAAEANFSVLAQKPPPPYVSRLLSDERSVSPTNGPIRTVSYEWSAEGAFRKILLTLTTATSEEAQLQGLGSVAFTQ